MATLAYSHGLPTYDWETLLADVLHNGTIVSSSTTQVTIDVGSTSVVLTGTGITVAGDVITAGQFTSTQLLESSVGVVTVNAIFTATDAENLRAAPDTHAAVYALLSTQSNTITGSGDAESLFGGDSNDNFAGGDGNDTIDGGGNGDNDTLDYAQEGGGGPVTVNFDFGTATDTYGATDSFSNIEEATGTTHNDEFTGGNSYTGLRGFAGDDTYHDTYGRTWIYYGNDANAGGASAVYINLSDQQVTTTGGIYGTHILAANTGLDGFGDTDHFDGIHNIRGTAGNDWIVGSDGNDAFQMQAGNDYIDGGSGFDVADYNHDIDESNAAIRGVIVNLSDATVTYNIGFGATSVAAGHATDGFGNLDTLISIEGAGGTQFSDVLVGSDDNNDLVGNAGNDTLIGNGGDDRLDGGAGTDFYDGGSGHNTISFINDGGTRGVDFNFTDGTIIDSFNNHENFAIYSIQAVEGTNFADVFTGSSDDNDFAGFGGDDIIYGGGGRDTVHYENESRNGGSGGVTVALGTTVSSAADSVDPDLGTIGTATDSYGDTDSLYSIENVIGTQFADTIWGSNEDNYLEGREGNDIILGRDGNDNINGGLGDDSVDGGDGDDRFDGGLGQDTVIGGVGNDKLSFRNDDDSHQTDAVNFVLDGADGTGHVTGSYFNDDTQALENVTTEFHSVDTFVGTRGDDTFEVDGAFVSDRDRDWRTFGDFRDPAGTVLFVGGQGSDTFTDNGTTDAPYGVAVLGYSDEYYGNDGPHDGFGVFINLSTDNAATYVGYDHDGISGDDTVASGDAIDTYGNTDHIVGVTLFDLTNGDDVFYGRDNVGGDQGEYVQGNDGNDFIRGGSAGDDLSGDNGNDTMYGGAGVDNMNGGDDNDSMFGGDGGDHMDGGNGDDVMSGEAGRDNMNGSDGNDTMSGGDDMDRVNGGSGNDVLHGNDGVDQIEGDQGSDLAYGDAGNDSVNGGDDNDYVYGDAGNDNVRGGQGNDVLFGDDRDVISVAGVHTIATNLQDGVLTGGNDQLNGDDGNDLLYGGNGSDTLDGGNDNDTLYGGNGTDSLNGGDGNDSVFGGAGGDNVHGGSGNDVVDGGSGNDNVYGDQGNDTLVGSAGTDNYYGYYGDDTYNLGSSAVGNLFDGGDNGENAGTDTVLTTITRDLARFGGVENATLQGSSTGSLYGNELANLLTGSSAANHLDGLDGNDTLIGGTGADTMSGGTGNDTFRFLAVGDSAIFQDLITDFSHLHDKIDLKSIDADTTKSGNQTFIFDAAKTASNPAKGHLNWNWDNVGGGHTIIKINVDADSTVEMTIRLDHHISLTSADFIL